MNLGLWLDRFALYERMGADWELTQQAKRRESAPLNLQAIKPLLDACAARWQATLESYQRQGLEVKQWDASPDWRLIVGLGAAHVLETSITLHRLYGIPLIPGSALKGLARAKVFEEITKALGVQALPYQERQRRAEHKPPILSPLQKLEKFLEEPNKARRQQIFNDLINDDAVPKDALLRLLTFDQMDARDDVCLFRQAFGTQEQAGEIIFFDAIPTEVPKFKLDVMNPHYGEYYRGGSTPPADWLSPVPVYFLTVERTPFLFAIGARRKEANGLVATAAQWLKAALSELGVGAKTAAGYGYFG